MLAGLNGIDLHGKVMKQFTIQKECLPLMISKPSKEEIYQMLMSGVSEVHVQTSVLPVISKELGGGAKPYVF